MGEGLFFLVVLSLFFFLTRPRQLRKIKGERAIHSALISRSLKTKEKEMGVAGLGIQTALEVTSWSNWDLGYLWQRKTKKCMMASSALARTSDFLWVAAITPIIRSYTLSLPWKSNALPVISELQLPVTPRKRSQKWRKLEDQFNGICRITDLLGLALWCF